MKARLQRLNIVAIYLCVFVLLFAATCKKNDCHRYIHIVNDSEDPVIYSARLYNGSIDSCLLLRRAILNPGETFKEFNRSCWNRNLEVSPFDMYIVEINGLDTSGFHECDSVHVHNDILRHYHLDKNAIDSLAQMNWTIYYR